MRRKSLISFVIILFLGNIVNAHPLDFYINTALKNSPLLKDYNNQLLSAGFDSLLVKASYKPQVTQNTQVLYPISGKNFGYDESITNGGNYSALVNVIQPLLNKKFIKGQIESVSLSSHALQVNTKITEIDLKKSVTGQYLTTFTNYNQLLSNKSVLKLLVDEQSVLKQMIDKGVYLVTDYMNLSVSIKAQQIAIKQSFIQYKNDLNLLNFLCGIADSSTVVLENPGITLNNIFDVNNSPVMEQFKIDSLKNLNSKYLVDLNYLPKLHAFADGGFNATMPKNIPTNFGTSFGLNLTMVIFDGKQRKLQYDKLALAENTRAYYRNYYTTQYKQQFFQLEEQLKLTNELIGAYKSQLADQEKLIDLYKIEIEKGLVRFMDFVTIVTNYTTTKSNFSMAEINRLQIINQMNYLK
jgi:outer membrane protein TolC